MNQVSYGTTLCIIVVVPFAVMASMTFLGAARDRENVVFPDHKRRIDCGIFVCIPGGFLYTLDRVGVFHLVRSSLFDVTRGVLPVSTIHTNLMERQVPCGAFLE